MEWPYIFGSTKRLETKAGGGNGGVAPGERRLEPRAVTRARDSRPRTRRSCRRLDGSRAEVAESGIQPAARRPGGLGDGNAESGDGSNRVLCYAAVSSEGGRVVPPLDQSDKDRHEAEQARRAWVEL